MGAVKNASINGFLKQKRIESGLSQNQVGRILGYKNGQFVSNWERGEQPPATSALPTLMRVYRIREEEMVNVLVRDSEVYFRKLLKKGRR